MKKSKIRVLCIGAFAGLVVCGSTMILPGNTAFSAQDGANLYAAHCGACHAGGGNVIDPALPVTGSSKMKSLAVFTAFNRNPLKPEGSKGTIPMPAFPKDKISDAEMKLIYEYSLKLPGPKK